MTPDILDVAWKVASALEAIGAPYYVGGSVASSLHATARSTNDIDFVVEMRPEHADLLAAALGDDFSVDTVALRDAIASNWSWNIFHLPSGLKIDLIMREPGEYDREAFARRRRFPIEPGVAPFVKTAEDSILKKLEWYRDGEEESSTQWRDVVELLRVNRDALDTAYLDRWAASLGLVDLLARAREVASGVGRMR